MSRRKTERLAGIHPVEEALRAGRRRFEVLYIESTLGSRGHPVVGLAEAAGVRVESLDREALAEKAGDPRHQGVLLEASPLAEHSLADLLATPGPGLILATDGVEDPQNFGALLRVADAAGVTGVLTTERRSPPLSLAVARASAGALEHVPVARVTNLVRGLRACREAGYWLVAASEQGSRSLYDPVLEALWPESVVLVLGSEGRGVRPSVSKLVDEVARIPMGGRVSSLNVATAAAAVLFEIRRCRLGANRSGR